MRPLLQFIFTLATVCLILGGAVIVGGQLVGLVLGRGAWLEPLSETLGPPTFVAASIAGVLAFVLSYWDRSANHDEDDAGLEPGSTGAGSTGAGSTGAGSTGSRPSTGTA